MGMREFIESRRGEVRDREVREGAFTDALRTARSITPEGVTEPIQFELAETYTTGRITMGPWIRFGEGEHLVALRKCFMRGASSEEEPKKYQLVAAYDETDPGAVYAEVVPGSKVIEYKHKTSSLAELKRADDEVVAALEEIQANYAQDN